MKFKVALFLLGIALFAVGCASPVSHDVSTVSSVLNNKNNGEAFEKAFIAGLLVYQQETYLNRLKERLKLTPDQETQLNEISRRRYCAMVSLLDRGMAITNSPAAMAAFENFDSKAEFDVVLTPEQRLELKAYEKELRAERARNAARLEVERLQEPLRLSNGQRVALLSQFTEIEEERLGRPDMDEKLEPTVATKKKAALESVLTPKQLKRYDELNRETKQTRTSDSPWAWLQILGGIHTMPGSFRR